MRHLIATCLLLIALMAAVLAAISPTSRDVTLLAVPPISTTQ